VVSDENGDIHFPHLVRHPLLPRATVGAILDSDVSFALEHRCDERFIGYGGNKAACLFEIYLSGVDFFVLSDDFIIHQSHPYAEQVRKHEVQHISSAVLVLFSAPSLQTNWRI